MLIPCKLPLPEKSTLIQVLKKLRVKTRDFATPEKISLCRKIPRYENAFIEIFLLVLKVRLTLLRKECFNALR